MASRLLLRHLARCRVNLRKEVCTHLQRRFASDTAGSVPSSTANSYINLGKFETMGADVGRAATGIAYLQETVQLQEAEYAAEVEPIRKSVKGMGLARNLLEVARQHHQLGDAAEAIAIYKRTLELFEEAIAVREKDDSEKSKKALTYARFALSEVLSSLGVAYNDSGRAEEALEMHQRALQVRKEIVGKAHPSVAECLNNLGGLYFARGSHQRAVEHFEQALELLTEAAEGRQDTPYVALTLYNLGLCRAHLGQIPAAATALKRALQIAERSLGPNHRQVELIRQTLKQGVMPAAQSPSAAQADGKPDAST
eukprot:TRINITY_DN61136_c0_g1_i1.p1 TRINITY_DN61136_c0_g1~~TRINITY_DN61136_c0_g1_i1.p1  ORF type:complete len:312 (+),score=72.70 TRINITY_DN61136_c0_g1_i1:51-986(+)